MPYSAFAAHIFDDAVAVAGVACLLLALRDLSLPRSSLGLIVLVALALAVRIYPLVRAYPAANRGPAVSFTAATPTLAVMALYGAAWAICVAVVSVAVGGILSARTRLDAEQLARGIARAALATTLAGIAFSSMGGVPGQISLALMLPSLSVAQITLALASWVLAASVYALESGTAYWGLLREGLVNSLPAVAAEPVLALVLAAAAKMPTSATLMAATLPLVGLIAALRLHADMRDRLQQTNAALSQAHQQLHIQATTDPLTGLANRRQFEDVLNSRLDESSRYGRPLSVLLLDLDSFKKINDGHGHAAGDLVLVAVAGALRRGLRRSDLPARLAGDEFVALLPETGGAKALTLAERVCAEIATLRVSVGDSVVTPTASVGVATSDGRSSVDPAGLLAAADGAAYAAKSRGKNAAYLAGGPPRRLPRPRQRARAAS